MLTDYAIRVTEELRIRTGFKGLTPEIVEAALREAKGKKSESELRKKEEE